MDADHNCCFAAVFLQRASFFDDRDQRFVPQFSDAALIITGEISGKALVRRRARIPIRSEPLSQGKGVAARLDHREAALAAADSNGGALWSDQDVRSWPSRHHHNGKTYDAAAEETQRGLEQTEQHQAKCAQEQWARPERAYPAHGAGKCGDPERD